MRVNGSIPLFGDAPKPQLEFLRLLSPPPRVKKADVSKIARFQAGDAVVVDTNPSKGLGGLRSAEIQRVELANPNYAPKPITDDPEPVYLLKLDSTQTTYARTSPRWVRESKIHKRPTGTQWDAWQAARPKWDRVWEEDKEFDELAEKQSEENVKRTLRDVNRRLLQSLSAEFLDALPVSRLTQSDEAEKLGLRQPIQRSISSAALRFGVLPKVTPPKLAPLRDPSPPRRHRQAGHLRQRRVRNQIAQHSEHPTLIDSKRQSPWYCTYNAPPPFVTRRASKCGADEAGTAQQQAPPPSKPNLLIVIPPTIEK